LFHEDILYAGGESLLAYKKLYLMERKIAVSKPVDNLITTILNKISHA
jgi:hypothetical protein